MNASKSNMGVRRLSTLTLTICALMLAGGSSARADSCACGSQCGGGDSELCVDTETTLTANASYTCVTICPGYTLQIGGNTLTITGADGLRVFGSPRGTLDVNGAGAVRLTGGSCSGHVIDGNILLSASGATLDISGTSGVILTGSGRIIGTHDGSRIIIQPVDGGVELETRLDVKGSMDFLGAGDFRNAGKVLANRANEVLTVGVTGTVDDTSGARWQVNTADAMLRFDEEPDCLVGDFTVSAGTLRAGNDAPGDDVDVTTSGTLTHTGGNIIAGTDDSFVFNTTCP